VLSWPTPLVMRKISLTGVVVSRRGTNRSGTRREPLFGRLGGVSESRSVVLKLLSEKKQAGSVGRERPVLWGNVAEADLGRLGRLSFTRGVLKVVSVSASSDEEERSADRLPSRSSSRLQLRSGLSHRGLSSPQRSGLT
jgi:hypothetical protein